MESTQESNQIQNEQFQFHDELKTSFISTNQLTPVRSAAPILPPSPQLLTPLPDSVSLADRPFYDDGEVSIFQKPPPFQLLDEFDPLKQKEPASLHRRAFTESTVGQLLVDTAATPSDVNQLAETIEKSKALDITSPLSTAKYSEREWNQFKSKWADEKEREVAVLSAEVERLTREYTQSENARQEMKKVVLDYEKMMGQWMGKLVAFGYHVHSSLSVAFR